jgi:small-conductance mechanosensitive channel
MSDKVNSDLGLELDVAQTLSTAVTIFFSLLISLIFIDVPLGEIGIFSGIVAAGLSIAMKDTLGNLMAGALLIADGSLKKGDVITIPRTDSNDTGSTYGIIQKMKMRYTVVEDRNTVRRLIPNSILVSSPIESWTHEDSKVRLSLKIGVAYDTDLAKAKQLMESVCYDVSRVLSEKPPQAMVTDFGESSIVLSLRFWLKDTSQGIRPVISEVLINLKQRFDEEGIEIPFPQRDFNLKVIDDC